MHDELACLSKAKLFSGLPQPVLEAVNQVATHRQFFKRGALVAGPLDAGQLLVIDEGQLQVTTSDAAGQRRVLDLLPARSGSFPGVSWPPASRRRPMPGSARLPPRISSACSARTVSWPW